MKKVGLFFTLVYFLCTPLALAQQPLRGQIIKAGSSVLDPNQDGFISKDTSGFSNSRKYWVPEFEIPMFGIPKLGGDVTGDNIGKSCGITDLIPDSLGYSAYAVRDANNNLIFRFRVGDNNPSVEAWTILLDIDGFFGANDPNTTDENPGFEVDITLIKNQNKGLLVYNIDGISDCPAPILTYPFSSHFQISYADEISCADPDYFYDFYVPFPEIANAFGIDVTTGVRFVALTNVSATCAMAGKISDISGVDNNDYKDCVTCAFSGLVENQCPTAIIDLCETCDGFADESVNAPKIDEPVRAGQTAISGTSDPNIFIIVQVFSRIGGTDQSPIWATTPRDQKSTYANDTLWSVTLSSALLAYDKIVARAQLDENSVPCGADGGNTASTSVTVVQPNAQPNAQDQIVEVTEDTPKNIVLTGTDADGDPFFYIIVSNPSNGTLSGTGANITYTPNPNYFGNDSFTFRVSDDILLSDIATVSINVLPVNDPPELTGSTTPRTFTNSPIVIDNTISIADVDDTQMEGAVIFISTNFQPSEDVLQFANQNGITGAYNAASGVLTLSGTSSTANYSSALASITYTNNDATPSTATRQVSFVVNDGTNNSNTHVRSIVVVDVNDPPIIIDDDGNDIDSLFYTIDEDTRLDTCINALDLNGDLVVIDTIVNLTGNGSNLTFSGLCFSYAPNADYSGEERLQIMITDQRNPEAGTDTALVIITVLQVNDPPVLSGTSTPVSYVSTPVTVDNTIGLTDIDDTQMESSMVLISRNFQGGEDVLQFTNQNGITGSYNASTGVLTLTGTSSKTNYINALRSITYTNINATPTTVTRQVSFIVNDGQDNSNTHIRSITLSNVNTPPVIVDNSNNSIDIILYTINEDQALNTCINALDLDGDLVVIDTVVNLTGNGNNPTFSGLCFNYIPNPNYFGEERLRIIVTDLRNPAAGRDTALAIITINPVNDPPGLAGSTTPRTFTNSSIVIDNTISIVDVDDTQMEGAVIFISTNLQPSEDVLRFTNQNGITGAYNPASGVLTLSGTSSISNYISALVSITYSNTDATPSTTTRQVSFVVNDGTNTSNTHVRSIVVVDVNDPPIIIGNTGSRIDSLFYTIDEDNRLDTCINVLDLDGDFVVIDTLVNLTGNGSNLTFSGLCFSYAPNADYFGEERLQIVITDQRNPEEGTDTALVIITIKQVNDPLVVGSKTITINENETVAICLDVTDKENDPGNFISGISENGTSIDNGNGPCFSYTPNLNFVGTDLVNVSVCEITNNSFCDTATVIIKVLRLNDAPVIDKPLPEFVMFEDSISEINLVCLKVTDDSPTQSFSLPVKLSGEGTLTPNDAIFAECSLYQPPLNWYGDTTWELEVCDNENPSLCDKVIAIIHVLPVNDPPIGVRDVLFTNNINTASINVLLNDADAVENDGLFLTETPISGPFNALYFTMAPDGTINYRPAQGFEGVDSLVYQVCDTGIPSKCNTSVVVFYVQNPLIIYNAVSPNGDGLNDYWRINGIEGFPNNLVRVYDRFNNLVFETHGYNNESNFWNGQSNHGLSRNNLPEGTYFYNIQLGNGTDQLGGYIVLKRQ